MARSILLKLYNRLWQCYKNFMEMSGHAEQFMFDIKYKVIQDTLESLMNTCTKAGIGLNKCQAGVVTENTKNVLWN